MEKKSKIQILYTEFYMQGIYGKGIYLWLGRLRPNVDINFSGWGNYGKCKFLSNAFCFVLSKFFFSFYMGCLFWASREQAVLRFLKIHIYLPQFLCVQRLGTTDMSLDEGCCIEILDSEHYFFIICKSEILLENWKCYKDNKNE